MLKGHVLAGQILAVGPLQAVLQHEGVDQAVVGDAVALGQIRIDVGEVGLRHQQGAVHGGDDAGGVVPGIGGLVGRALGDAGDLKDLLHGSGGVRGLGVVRGAGLLLIVLGGGLGIVGGGRVVAAASHADQQHGQGQGQGQ